MHTTWLVNTLSSGLAGVEPELMNTHRRSCLVRSTQGVFVVYNEVKCAMQCR
jgi:hypothetical protein